jgi:mannose-6-phosphate isomerase-like protein (cupin superfamily)
MEGRRLGCRTDKEGKVSLVFFAPRNTDYQTSHEGDEFYVIVRGKGCLIIGSDTFSCETGDAFFVPAKTPHHFENFTDDFATWAIFF